MSHTTCVLHEIAHRAGSKKSKGGGGLGGKHQMYLYHA